MHVIQNIRLIFYYYSICRYVGHGAGARFLDAQRVLKGNVRAVALLFGCSSGALSVQGCLEGTGLILSYLIAGWYYFISL